MSFRACVLCCIAIIFTALMPAQFGHAGYIAGGSNSTISTSGSVTINIKPERLRMYVQVAGGGKTLKDALANLKKHYQAAVPRLEKMGANKDSISMGTPTIAGQVDSDKMNMMIRAHLGKSKPDKKGPKVYQVTASLTAEWPLTTDKPEELLLFVDNLTEQIGKIDLTGKKDKKELSPEEQELLEEMDGSVTEFTISSNDDDDAKPGQPHFVYVGTVTEEQVDKAMREAFAQAKQEAQRLARVAEVKLGPLSGLSGGGTGAGIDFDGLGYSYSMQNRLQRMMQGIDNDTQEKENEALANKPGPIRYRVSVTTRFEIEKQGD